MSGSQPTTPDPLDHEAAYRFLLEKGVENWNIWRSRVNEAVIIDLRNYDFRGRDLHGINLTRCLLSNCDLTGTNFSRANLEHAHLDRVPAQRASFVDASLRYASLQAADLRQATFMRADLHSAIFSRADVSASDFRDAVNIDQANLRDVKGSGRAIFDQGVLERLTLHWRNADASDLDDAFKFLQSEDTKSWNQWRRSVDIPIGLNGRDLSDLSLAHANLARCLLDRSDLSRSNLFTSNLEGAHLNQITAIETTFSGANLRGASLRGADLRNAIFRSCNLIGADFAEADIQGCDFRGAKNITEAKFDKTVGVETAIFDKDAVEYFRFERRASSEPSEPSKSGQSEIHRPRARPFSQMSLYGLTPQVEQAILAAVDAELENQVRGLVRPLHPADVADLLSRLDPDRRRVVIEVIRGHFDPEILPYLDEDVREDVFEVLGTRDVSGLDPDESVTLTGEQVVGRSKSRIRLRVTAPAQFKWSTSHRRVELRPIPPQRRTPPNASVNKTARDAQLQTVARLAADNLESLRSYEQSRRDDNRVRFAKDISSPLNRIQSEAAKPGSLILASYLRAKFAILKKTIVTDIESLEGVDQAMLRQLLDEGGKLWAFFPELAEIDDPHGASLIPDLVAGNADEFADKLIDIVESEAGQTIFSDETKDVIRAEREYTASRIPALVAHSEDKIASNKEKLARFGGLVGEINYAMENAPKSVHTLASFAQIFSGVRELWALVRSYIGW